MAFVILEFLLIGATVFCLVWGISNLMVGGRSDRSQRLMRWRVGLQFLAILLLAALFYGKKAFLS